MTRHPGGAGGVCVCGAHCGPAHRRARHVGRGAGGGHGRGAGRQYAWPRSQLLCEQRQQRRRRVLFYALQHWCRSSNPNVVLHSRQLYEQSVAKVPGLSDSRLAGTFAAQLECGTTGCQPLRFHPKPEFLLQQKAICDWAAFRLRLGLPPTALPKEHDDRWRLMQLWTMPASRRACSRGVAGQFSRDMHKNHTSRMVGGIVVLPAVCQPSFCPSHCLPFQL